MFLRAAVVEEATLLYKLIKIDLDKKYFAFWLCQALYCY